MSLELFDDDGNYIPKPSEVRPIQGFKKPFWNATIKGDIITFEFIPRDDEDNEKRYEYAQRFLPKRIRERRNNEPDDQKD